MEGERLQRSLWCCSSQTNEKPAIVGYCPHPLLDLDRANLQESVACLTASAIGVFRWDVLTVVCLLDGPANVSDQGWQRNKHGLLVGTLQSKVVNRTPLARGCRAEWPDVEVLAAPMSLAEHCAWHDDCGGRAPLTIQVLGKAECVDVWESQANPRLSVLALE